MANQITADISGIIRELNIPITGVLYPFFEAVVNSIQAIQERNDIFISQGKITITIERDKSQQELFDAYAEYPIKSITIKDNGIGFNKDNFESFGKAHTTKKAKLGGKGLGRFAMLSVFKYLKVTSITKSNDSNTKSLFSLSNEGLSDLIIEETKNEIGTTICLDDVRQKYVKETAKYKQEVIADSILEHCLLYFLSGDVPQIEVIEDNTVINLANQFSPHDFVLHSYETTIEGKPFKWYIVKNVKSKYHELSLCAHNRKVKGKKLKKILPVFSSPLKDGESEYYITLYAVSGYLDDIVNMSRTGFDFPHVQTDENTENELGIECECLIVEKDIDKSAAQVIRDHFLEEMSIRTSQTVSKVEQYRSCDDGLEYRHLELDSDFYETIPNDADERTLDEALHDYQYKKSKELRKKREKLLAKDYSTTADYQELLDDVIKSTTAEGTSRLAQYVAHRKTIIELLERYLEWSEKNNNYEEESVLHNLIYTMGGTDKTIPYDKHNLWLLDDRLTFHRYIYSDKQVRLHTPAEGSNCIKETDIAIYDVPFTYGEKSEYDEVNSVVIFELKRPDRTVTYEEFSKQMREQIMGVKGGQLNDYNKKHIVTDKSTPVYFYYVCDTNAYVKLKESAIMEGFKETPYRSLLRMTDGNVVQEILTYQVLLVNAKRRNTIFFKRLGIQ